MKDISSDIEYKGNTYKLVFNLNVMETIQDEYGSLDAWGDLLDGTAAADSKTGQKGEVNVKAVKFGLMAMINEGIDMKNEEEGTDIKPFTAKQIGRMLTEVGLGQAVDLVNSTVVESTQSGDDRKNESSKTKSTQS